MAECLLYEATEFFQPFPDPQTVFSRDVEKHCEYLLPLATIDLARVDPKLNGRGHFIQSFEPWDGVVGDGGDAYFNHYCRENYIGYQYNDDGRCELMTDFKFFELARSPDNEILSDLYAKVRSGFAKTRAHFETYGVIHSRFRKPPYQPEHRNELIREIGAPSEGGNWPTYDFPLHREKMDVDGEEVDHIVPLTEDGRLFIFVGALQAWHYAQYDEHFGFDCDLLLFYDPETRIGLTTFDWS